MCSSSSHLCFNFALRPVNLCFYQSVCLSLSLSLVFSDCTFELSPSNHKLFPTTVLLLLGCSVSPTATHWPGAVAVGCARIRQKPALLSDHHTQWQHVKSRTNGLHDVHYTQNLAKLPPLFHGIWDPGPQPPDKANVTSRIAMRPLVKPPWLL